MNAKQALDFARDASGIGVYQVNLKTGMLFADDRYFAMLGYVGDEIKPTLHWWRDALHPDDVDAVSDSLDELLTGKSDRLRGVYRMRHRDGHWVWVEDRARIFERDQDGQPVLTFGVHMDVSPHRMLSNRLPLRQSRIGSQVCITAIAFFTRLGAFMPRVSVRSVPIASRSWTWISTSPSRKAAVTWSATG